MRSPRMKHGIAAAVTAVSIAAAVAYGQSGAANPHAAALREFEQRLQSYLELRDRLTASLTSASPINGAYPADVARSTVPPLLLRELPRLPDGLQYRFYGCHVVLLDGNSDVIIDYVADAFPPH